ncbi:MAG: glycoside hydrolase family 3 N-terminal domain-containing protein [bacterium]|nr:glycoside hydrolase family 3 N-terminal domain-containing protein [bacterium]
MLKTTHLILFALLVSLISKVTFAQNHVINWQKNNPWVDSVMNTLTLDEKIAQLFTVAVWTQRDSNYLKDIEKLVKDNKIGGLMFMKGTPHKQAVLTNRYQAVAKVPLLISIDGEWGLNMRLDSTPVFPRQMILGAANNASLTEEMAAEIAKHCKRLGIHVNFAPDIDVNNNPANPVINDRSFGENKYVVAKQGIAYMKGLQNNHVLATAKHFPGHGDTESDSHFNLPVIKGNRKRLDSLELYPFKELIKNDVGSIMVGHLFVPAIDTTNNRASSISPLTVKKLLKEEMGFEGLIVTDGLNMKGVANYAAPGEVSAKALAAGNELLLFVEEVPQSIFWIKDYMSCGLISEAEVNNACRKILITKHWAGLNKYKAIELANLNQDLNCCATDLLIKKVIKQGIVVAKNMDNLIPFESPEKYKIASLAVGNNQFTSFQQTLSNYVKADYYSIDKSESLAAFDSMFSNMQRYNLVIISLHNTSRFVSRKLGLTQAQISFINRLILDRKCILVNHGNPYILQYFTQARNVIVAYEDLPLYNQLAAQVLMGAIPSKGKMPVSVTAAFPLASGIMTEPIQRFEYVMPEEVGVDHFALSFIDTMVLQGIKEKAMPGCQVFIAQNGKVIYNKSFGSFTYDTSSTKVQNYHLYDLASLTKVLATTLAIMKLYDEKAIGLNDKLGLYLPFLRGTAKEKISIKDVLLHQAGFPAFIPFYKRTIINGKLDTAWYSNKKTDKNCLQLTDSLWIDKNCEQEMFNVIAMADLRTSGEYLYSDLGFILLRKLVENVSNMPFEAFMNEHFYDPLSIANLSFNPLKSGVPKASIAPTEMDTAFRKQLLQGYVHDPAASMLGGVSGHAGLFGNANSVGILMQMLLNEGIYGNVRVLKASTVQLFTSKQNKKSRRGLGFDKPETNPLKPSPTGSECSPLTFGHTGFTGVCAWADPKTDLVYVFLSNRVYPNAENNKLAQSNLRTRIQDYIYEVTRKK